MMKSQLKESISNFPVISLNDSSKVKFFDRIDKKYVLNIDLLPDLLQQISDYYYIMTVNNSLELNYHTSYYDTENFFMYYAHHNKKTNRFKIRTRQYLNSGDIFCEIKIKKKGIYTSKKRIKIDEPSINKSLNCFIEKYTPFNYNSLFPAVSNKFTRLFLIAKDYKERVTIDYDLSIINNNSNCINLDNFTIIEIKKEKSKEFSIFQNVLKTNLIRNTGFSKYCMGMVLTNNTIKYNRFKKNLLLISACIKSHEFDSECSSLRFR